METFEHEMKNAKKDKDGYCTNEVLDAQVALNFLAESILGKDWYIESPMRNFQANPIIVNEIIKKYNRATESPFKKIKRFFSEILRELH